MDESIRKLKSTTFFGRRLTRRQIAEVQSIVRGFPALSRRELGHTVCEHLNWRTPGGNDSIQSALGLLEALETAGVVVLPEKDASRRPGRQGRPVHGPRSEPQPPIECALDRLLPLRAEPVEDPDEVALWNELVDRHHYLGYRRPVGPHLRYAIVDRDGRWLGCVLFQFAVPSLACRDDFIGWDAAARQRRLHLVLGNTRLLILPWVRVDNLVSKALSLLLRRLPDDWKARHGCRPVLVETFVDPERFDGACYRAANWTRLGRTRGKGAVRTPKEVFVWPLDRDFRPVLCRGQAPAPHRKPVPGPSAGFVDRWGALVEALAEVSEDFDHRWRKRRRVLNTLLVALFVFRLVLSGGRQGYHTALAELWAHCRANGIPLPQPRPVSASAMGNARAKLHEDLFRELHAEVLRRADAGDIGQRRWHGHRLHAVDGSKLNLPRGLIEAGYRIPSPNAHYPQGLLSCLYRLHSRVPVDFDLVSHKDERRAALSHLQALSPGDVVVYDRGYFSADMLRAHVQRGLHPVFRLAVNANAQVAAFVADGVSETQVEIDAGAPAPLPLRLVRYEIDGNPYFLGTTLLDPERYPAGDLARLYHERWGIEEMFKTAKQTLVIERFHGQSERKVKQELFACFVLIAIARLFANHGEDLLDAGAPKPEGRKMQANFRHALHTLGQHLEVLLLAQAELVRDAANRVFHCIVRIGQAQRPDRSYPRISRRPIGKWKPSKPAKTPAVTP
ncbi:MAG: IS4 family transposase [Rhodospirillaceae bacterium]|nr:IS4 family transposase [Rhodospirillaceae bacterium]